jgi:2-polyprenyl-3-methyl-5-hydroxy-6-metoxy-1,4-benzoquinol methylase
MQPSPRLSACPTFAVKPGFDGRTLLVQDCEPYAQFWIDADEQLLHAIFCALGGLDALEGARRFVAALGGPLDAKRLGETLGQIELLRAAGVLIEAGRGGARYDGATPDDYLRHRPFPPLVARWIAERSNLGAASEVLDLAGGPGDLAVQLAALSASVSLMELSQDCLRAALTRAGSQNLPLRAFHDSANRLAAHECAYDLVTLCQALPWLDDIALCKGLEAVLRPAGEFVLVQSALRVGPDHPLAFVLGEASILGAGDGLSHAARAAEMTARLEAVFKVVAPRGETPFRAVETALFEERRVFDAGFVRAFATDRHLVDVGMDPAAFRDRVDRAEAEAPRGALVGCMDWAVVRFRRETPRPSLVAPTPAPIVFGLPDGACAPCENAA